MSNTTKYTDEQLEFVDYTGTDSLLLKAIAGSGKTTATVGRVKKMIEDGVDPSRMVLFSYTNDAVNELKVRIGNKALNICTIHSFAATMLNKIGAYKKVSTFYDFVSWYRDKKNPSASAPFSVKQEFNKIMTSFYEEGGAISSSFAAYKLQVVEDVLNREVYKPKYFDDYRKFLKETNSRDFSDMLLECDKMSQDPKYSHHFEGLYDYIFIDEYQDTSPTQTRILLRIKPKQIFLIGDEYQSIYGYSGASCVLIQDLVKEQFNLDEMTLTYNFRSDKSIVERSNKYTNLEAKHTSENDGYINETVLTLTNLLNKFKEDKPLVALVRTNKVIKYLEWLCLKEKIPMRYFNFITEEDLKNIEDGNVHVGLQTRLKKIVNYYGNTTKLVEFIRSNSQSDKFITSIHKSKGREFPNCVVVNSVDPEQILTTEFVSDYAKYTFINEMDTIDQESKNIHYVATTRPKHELYFALVDETKAIIR